MACGPGLVVCAFADVVEHATGIDLTPAMIEKARELQSRKQLANVAWRVGDVLPLPYADAAFNIVTSRYALHHLESPAGVVAEMARVCAPGGKVLLADVFVSDDPAKAAAYNRMEKLRDPSHVRALALARLEELTRGTGLTLTRTAFYRLEVEVESLLAASFPNSGDAAKVRAMIQRELECDEMGLSVWRVGEEIHFAYPIAVLVASKPD